ncbi:MAG: hypothetical protein XE06_1368, partial [Anaerolineaceae bacterium 46_22]
FLLSMPAGVPKIMILPVKTLKIRINDKLGF